MSERQPCIRCGRSIDAYARICPYCSWAQDEPVPASVPAPRAAAPAYEPPPDRSWRRPVFGLAGAVVLLVGSFVVGANAHSRKPPTGSPRGAAAVPAGDVARPASRANVTLVPDNSPLPSSEPITSAPVTTTAQGAPNEYERTDATAASSSEYAQMAQRAAAEKKSGPALVDPRSITGSTYPMPVPRRPVLRQQLPVEAQAEPAAVVIPPVPVYQPVPDVRVRENVTARLELLVGPDGRVHDVRIVDPLPGDTGRLIGAVQGWRFRPATRNGSPVASSFTTALSFHANE